MNTDEKPPLRVLHILGSVQCGGVETVIFNNYRAMDKNKVQFDIVIDDCSPCKIPSDIIASGAKIYKIPSYTKLPSYINSIRKICKQNNYQIVHSHMNTMSIFSLLAAWLSRVPVRIVHSHSTSGSGSDLKRDLLKYILRPFSKIFATHYFACSVHAARWLYGDKCLKKGKVTILNNAISTEKFKFNVQKRNDLRKALKLNGKFVVGHVGRFSPPKNHFFLIKVFNALCTLRNDCVLLLIGGLGTGGNGIESDLRKMAEDFGIENKIFFLGTREDTSNYYQAMDVFVLPSLYEGLGIACIEAQCSGLPCVLSEGVPKEVQIIDEVRFLSLDKSVLEWAKVISEDKTERHDCSSQITKSGYDINLTVKELEEFYLTHVLNNSNNNCKKL